MNLAWAIRRLGAMSGREVAYRIGQRVRNDLDFFHSIASPPIIGRLAAGKPWVAPLPRRLRRRASIAAAADRILSGDFQSLRCARRARLPAALESRSKDRAGRAARARQDARLSRRAAGRRHQISVGAEPSCAARDARPGVAPDRRQEVSRRVVDCCWIPGSSSVPIALGPHWTSSLELALRLVNWSFAWHLLGGEQLDAVPGRRRARRSVARWLTSIHQHCHFISRPSLASFLGEQSSAGRADRPVRLERDLAAVDEQRALARQRARVSWSARRSCRTASTASISRAGHLVSP